MTTKLFLMCVTAAGAAYSGVAMPTEAEVEKAVPKVERMLASEKVALESGKMTRAEVAEEATKLAAGVDDEAAKLLLMKGAFILHVKDGNLEKAVKTMSALETAIADMPPQVVTNIIETALLGLPNKKEGARLYRLLDATKVSAKSAVVEGKSLKAVVGGHTWSYTIRNGGASIEAPGGKYECAVFPTPEGSIVIPSKLGGVSVTRIGRAAFTRCHALTDVTIPPTVTSIGMSAFYECRMKSVTIPSAVKEIGELAFYNSSLKSVTIPEGVTSIGGGAFGDCWSLESVSIPSSVTSIGMSAVASGSNRMKSIDVSPDNPKYAVYGDLLCTKDGKTVLGSVGGEVKIPDGVTCIAERAFYKCYGLTSVVIPSSVVEIGDSAFEWCDDIYSFDVSPENRVVASPNGLLCTKDGKTVIAGVNGDIVIPEGVTRIGDSAFTGRRGLTSVTMPSSVRSLGSEVFRCCKGLESVTMRGEKPNAQKGLFDYCDKLKAIRVPVNAKSWSGMKNWFGIRLVFDGCLQGQEAQAANDAERLTRMEQEKVQRETAGNRLRGGSLRVRRLQRRQGNCAANKPVPEKSSVAEKLGQCDFLLNKDFKKNAKYYFYLLSDYWRSEMPRIAKTYAEMLKDDPGIELIHVLYGRDYEKALAWAKEHDVKFPIVKDNPLRLYWRTSGDYMFIVNADGSVLKEGQPKILFTEEKLRRLKNGEPLSNAATINGVKWTYEIVDDAIVLGEGTSRGGLAVPKNTVGDITIPETIDGNPVRGIGEYAFAGCSGLTSITIPSSVTKIANTAFEGCRGLTSISIPSSVRKIDAGVFNGCANLKSISVSAENEQYASCGGVLFDKSMQTLVCYPCGIRGVYAIPEGVMCIGRSAFSAWASRYSGLSGVKIPDSVKSVGDYSFDCCQRLTEVILGNGVTTIGSCAFRDCDGLTSIKIPRSVVNIDHSAFIFCSGLKEFIVDPSNQKFTAVNGLLLSKDGSELLAGIDGDVIVPDGVKSVGSQAFCQYSGLTSVKLPSSLTDIGDSSFYSCVAMTSITIPANVKSIGRSAFGRCRSLTSVTMCGERPESPDDVFSSCDELKSIHVPANAKSWAGMKEWQGIPLAFDAK